MNSFGVSAAMLLFAFAGILGGHRIRRRLPDHHLLDQPRGVIEQSTGMIATLVALVIGLLVSSSKTTYDEANQSLVQSGAKILMLDGLLARYGSDAAPARQALRRAVDKTIKDVWPESGPPRIEMATVGAATHLESAYDLIRALAPADEPRKYLQGQAVQLCGEILQSRWLLIETSQTGLPFPFLVVLAFWMTILFLGLSLQAKENVTIQIALVICAASMAGAIFLILELNRPMEGSIKVSPAPLLKARAVLGN